MEKIKENGMKIMIEIDKEFYQELEAEAARQKIPIPTMLNRILLDYFFPPQNPVDNYNYKT